MLTYRHGRCAIHPSLDDDLPSLDDVHIPTDGPLDDVPSFVDVPHDDVPSFVDVHIPADGPLDDLPSLDDVHTPADGPLDDVPSFVDVPFDNVPSLADDYHGGRGLQPVICRHTYDTNLLLPKLPIRLPRVSFLFSSRK